MRNISNFCKKIYGILKEPILYIATFIIILITIAVSIPERFGLPDGILDSIILILTLIGLFIDSSGNSDLKDCKEKIINFLFNIEASLELWFRFVVILLASAMIGVLLYILSPDKELYKLVLSLVLLAMPYLLLNFGLTYYYYKNKKEGKNIKSESIYYIYLLLIYCSALLQKF